MIIGIDARELEGKRTGVGRYLEGLLLYWSKLENKFTLFFIYEIPEIPILSSSNFKKVRVPFIFKGEGWLWEQIALPLVAKKEKIDILFSPSYTSPIFSSINRVLTIHDLSYFHNPLWFPLKERFRRRFFSRISAKISKRILTVSTFVRDEIEKRLRIEREKIDVIYHGVHPLFQSIRKKRENVILTVGAIFQRRNIPLLAESFASLKKDDWKLVIVGDNRTYPKMEIKEIIRKFDIENQVELQGYIGNEELLNLYNTSSIFVSLSEYEGFGLPVIEAMACGLPCILYYGHSYKELFDGSAYFIYNLSSYNVKMGINELIINQELREELSSKGMNTSKRFSLENCANKTLDSILKAK